MGIDLVWYPDGDPNGSFRLLAILDNDWETLLLEFSSRCKREIVKMMEKWLYNDFMPRKYIEEELFRKNHSERI